MKDRLSKKAVLIEALTGIVLLTYVGYRIYRCAVTAVPLDVFPFMIFAWLSFCLVLLQQLSANIFHPGEKMG